MKKDKNPTQEYLSQIGWYEARMESLRELKARRQAQRERITSSWRIDRVSESHNPDQMGDITAEIEEIDGQIKACKAKIKKITAVIDQVRDKHQYEVLSKVYLHGKTLEQAACEIGFTYRNVCYIHGRALQAVAAVMESEDKHA